MEQPLRQYSLKRSTVKVSRTSQQVPILSISKRGIDKAVAAATAAFAKQSKKVKDREEIRQVATVSANWDAQKSVTSSLMQWTALVKTAQLRLKKPRVSKHPST